MQQHLTEQAVVYSAKSDAEKSFDYILPEYLPGISRIIKTAVSPETCTFIANMGECACQAAVKISIIYISEYDGRIKSASFREEFSVPFKETFGHTGEFTAIPSFFVSSAHTAMLSPRKVSVKMNLQASVSAYSENVTPVFSPSEQDGMCVLKNKELAFCKKILPETQLEKTAEISIDADKAGVGEIVYTDAAFLGVEAECGDGSLDFNASISLRMLYESAEDDGAEKGVYSYLDTDIKLADTVHFANISDGDIPYLYIDILSAEPSVALDPYGENRLISMTVKYTVSGFAYSKKECEFVTDAFLEGCSANPEMSAVFVDTLHSHISKKEYISQNVRADIREITEVNACNTKILSVSTEHSEGRFFAVIKCLAGIFGTNLSGELSALDVPLMLKVPLGTEESLPSDAIPDCIISISGCSAQIKDGGLKMDFEVDVNGVFVLRSKSTVVSSMSQNDEKDMCRKGGEIIIYYPKKGEPLWEIAKRYRVSPEKICLANGKEEKALKDCRTVIIP